MEALANRSVRVRWRVIQGFQSDRRGTFIPGVMGLSTESAAVIRRPLPEAMAGAAVPGKHGRPGRL